VVSSAGGFIIKSRIHFSFPSCEGWVMIHVSVSTVSLLFIIVGSRDSFMQVLNTGDIELCRIDRNAFWRYLYSTAVSTFHPLSLSLSLPLPPLWFMTVVHFIQNRAALRCRAASLSLVWSALNARRERPQLFDRLTQPRGITPSSWARIISLELVALSKQTRNYKLFDFCVTFSSVVLNT
jgi:hypothetical protein